MATETRDLYGMRIFTADYLRDVGIDILVACGAPRHEAEIVVDELVEASLMGLDSHGVIRYIWYTNEVLNGSIKPGAPVRVLKETPNTATIDCGFNFGPVGATHMVEIICNKARNADIACVISLNSHHVGRLGAYVLKVAEQGMFCFATANSHKQGHYVVPWGGLHGRLATNPLAYAAPTTGCPIVLDMSTSMIAEGKVRVLMHEGKPVPPGCVRDAHGNLTCDPKDFYGPPLGTILPFGSELGYKGFGLGLLVEILSATLAGVPSSVDLPYLNGLCMIAINPNALSGSKRFVELMDDLCRYITSSPPAPGFKEVIMPGTMDFRMRERRLASGIPIAEETWQQIIKTAEHVGVRVDRDIGSHTSRTIPVSRK